jgi:hypothetical protein
METATMMTFGDVAGGGDDGLTEMRGVILRYGDHVGPCRGMA